MGRQAKKTGVFPAGSSQVSVTIGRGVRIEGRRGMIGPHKIPAACTLREAVMQRILMQPILTQTL